jgi:hypothetical protein
MRRTFQSLALICATFASPANAAVDSCLVGTWWADISDLADMMALQMNGAASPAGGDVRMDVDASGSFRITVRDLQINVQIPDAPATTVTVTGFSAGSFDATANAWTAVVPSYNLVGSADILGQTMSIPFNSATGMFGGGLGWYDCTSTRLRFETDPARQMQMVRDWRRG